MTRRFETRLSPIDAANELEKVCHGGKGSGIPYVGAFSNVSSREKPNGGYEIRARDHSFGCTTEVYVDIDPNRDTGKTNITVNRGESTSEQEANRIGEDIEEKYFHD